MERADIHVFAFPAALVHDHRMTRSAPKEYSAMTTLPFFGGVDLLTARFVTQRFSRHFHEGYAVGCIEDGAMRFRYLGETVVAPRGQVNLVVPGEPHDGHGADESGWAYRMFYLRPEALMEAARSLMVRPSLPNFRTGVIDDPELASCVRRTHRILADGDASALEKETRLYWLLVQWISRHADERGRLSEPGGEHRAVARAREILQDRYGEDVGLGELAREAGLSPFHLLRVFERQRGITPHAYLTQVRTERAREMLGSGKRLADIAAECGFSDQAHLTRLFKARFGVTPGRLRKILQNN